MQPGHLDPQPGPPPTPSATSSPTRHPQAPTTEYHVPALPTVPRINQLRAAAGAAVAGLAVNILLDLTDTVLTPLADSKALRGTAAADDPLTVLTHGLAWLQLAALLATGAAFISWLYVARKNLDAWRIRGLRWGPGWAISAWIVPLANLVMPAAVMNTVLRGSRTPPDETEAPQGHSPLVWSWWLIYLCAAIGDDLFGSHKFHATDTMPYIAGYNAARTVPSIAAAALAIVLVMQITRRQAHRRAALDQSPAYPRA
jgi:Domain of unknown function (DUF4328)